MNVRTVPGRAYGGALQEPVSPAPDVPKSQRQTQLDAQRRYYYANQEKLRAAARRRMNALNERRKAA